MTLSWYGLDTHSLFCTDYEDVISSIRGQSADVNDQLKALGDTLRDEAAHRHEALIHGVQQAAQGITLPNVEEVCSLNELLGSNGF